MLCKTGHVELPERFGRTFFRSLHNRPRMRVRARVVYRGLVQGVFFRANTKRCADSLDVTGWVRNTDDGSVEAEFEGEEAAVKRAIEECGDKQPYARVDSKEVMLLEGTKSYSQFTIKY